MQKQSRMEKYLDQLDKASDTMALGNVTEEEIRSNKQFVANQNAILRWAGFAFRVWEKTGRGLPIGLIGESPEKLKDPKRDIK
jgi:hypothetical protein